MENSVGNSRGEGLRRNLFPSRLPSPSRSSRACFKARTTSPHRTGRRMSSSVRLAFGMWAHLPIQGMLSELCIKHTLILFYSVTPTIPSTCRRNATNAAPAYALVATPVPEPAQLHVATVWLQYLSKNCRAGTSRRKSHGAYKLPMLSFGLAHPLDNISHALDDLSQVVCEVVVMKKLPTCEHEVKMRCSDDPALYRCRAACKGILSCCGRNCQASCHDCQDLNKPGPEEEVEGPILRKSHQQHPCQRRLYCEHQCDRMCSSDHECTTECKKECRQSCAHARCRRPCSEPCAPCQGPCAWYVQIFHFATNILTTIQ